MSKRFSSIDRQRLRLANILQRLPLHRQLNESQSFLIKLTPTWQQWSKNNLANELQNEASPAAYQAGVLSIACHNAICASQIKHQQTSLLAALHKSGFSQITKLKIRVTQSSIEKESRLESTAIHSSDQAPTQQVRVKANAPTIKSIENCQKAIPNERLANSMKNLADTLKKTE